MGCVMMYTLWGTLQERKGVHVTFIGSITECSYTGEAQCMSSNQQDMRWTAVSSSCLKFNNSDFFVSLHS